MSATVLRKSITISPEENQLILDYARKVGKSFSEVLRTATISYIKENEKKDLAAFLAEHCDYVSKSEQQDFDNIIEKLKRETQNDSGKEIKVSDLL